MKLISIDNIVIPANRQRREFDEKKLRELADSIESRGLLHPPVLRNDEETLVAGERRIKAIGILHSESRTYRYNGEDIDGNRVPYACLGELSDLEFREAELEENIIREDLSWQDKSQALADLHALRTQQHGTRRAGEKEGWSFKDTADEVKGSPANARERTEMKELAALSKHLDDPLISAAKTPKEAMRLLREDQKRRLRQERAEAFDPASSDHAIHLGSCYDLLQGGKYKETFDVILTDPPYGIDIDKITFWDGDKHDYKDDEETFSLVCNTFPILAYNVAKPQAHAYIFCDIRRFNDLFIGFELAGWDCWPIPFIWSKGNTGSFPNADYGPRRTYEAILYANKGQKKVTAMYTDVIKVTNPGQQNHPAGKPVEVYVDLLRRSVYPGDKVLDAFCGAGPIFPAAAQLDCFATGIEINEKYYHMAIEKLESLK